MAVHQDLHRAAAMPAPSVHREPQHSHEAVELGDVGFVELEHDVVVLVNGDVDELVEEHVEQLRVGERG